MMNCKRLITGALGLVFLLTACGPRQISERKMKAIIQDIFMVNAYQTLYGSGSGINTDSVDLYTPILESYGYDLADFRYTVDRWALQKSSKLSELIDAATTDIQRENEANLARQRARERVDTLIGKRYRDTLYRRPDSLWVRSRRNLDSLRITLPAAPGRYEIRYRYRVDTTDRNTYLTLRYTQLDSAGKTLRSNTRNLTLHAVSRMEELFTGEQRIDSLRVLLADYPKNDLAVAIRVDSVYILYNEPIEAGRKRFLSDMVRLVLGMEYPYEPTFPPQDSGALHVVPPLRPDTARHTDL